MGTKEGLLDYGFFDLNSFQGSFSRSGKPLMIGNVSTEKEIVKISGEPYWIGRSDGEAILFYEYRAGTVEVRFEFPDGRTLGCITLSKNGVLSEPADQKAYGVTKSWPPK